MGAMQVMGSRYSTQSAPWESFVSIGDSEVEKRAAQELGRECAANGSVKWTKTLKLIEHPDVDKLLAEVRAMTVNLRDLVEHQGHKHVHINDFASAILEMQSLREQ